MSDHPEPTHAAPSPLLTSTTPTTNANLAGSSSTSSPSHSYHRYHQGAAAAASHSTYDSVAAEADNNNTDNGLSASSSSSSSQLRRTMMSSRSYEYQAARLATSAHRHPESSHSLSRPSLITHIHNFSFDDERPIEGAPTTHHQHSMHSNIHATTSAATTTVRNHLQQRPPARLPMGDSSDDLNDDRDHSHSMAADLKQQHQQPAFSRLHRHHQRDDDRDDALDGRSFHSHRYHSDEDSGNNEDDDLDDEDDTALLSSGDDEPTSMVDENNNAVHRPANTDNSPSHDGGKQRVQTAQLTSVIMSTSASASADAADAAEAADEAELEDAGDSKLDDKKKPYGGRPLKFVCDKCDRRFHAPSHLKRHMLCHSTERPYKCQVCGKGFLQAWHLGRHMTTHTGNKPFQCSMCPKSFGSRFEMNTHYNYIHKGIKEHQCKVCNKHFTLRSNLKVHMRKHTGEKPYSCHICKKKFGQRGHLQYHLQKHIRDRGLMLSAAPGAAHQDAGQPSPNNNNTRKRPSNGDLKLLPPLPPMLSHGAMYPSPPSIGSDSGVESLVGSPPSGHSSGDSHLGSPPTLHSPLSERSRRERSTSLCSSTGGSGAECFSDRELPHDQSNEPKKPMSYVFEDSRMPWAIGTTGKECCNDQSPKPAAAFYGTPAGSSLQQARLPEFPKLFMSRQEASSYHGSSDAKHPSAGLESSYGYLQRHQPYHSPARASASYKASFRKQEMEAHHHHHPTGGYSCCSGSVGGTHHPNSSTKPPTSYMTRQDQSYHPLRASPIPPRKPAGSIPADTGPRRDHPAFYESASAALAAMSSQHSSGSHHSKPFPAAAAAADVPPMPQLPPLEPLHDAYLSPLEKYYSVLRMQMMRGGNVPLPPMPPVLPTSELAARVGSSGVPVSAHHVGVPPPGHPLAPVAAAAAAAALKQELPAPAAAKRFRGIHDILTDAR